MAGSKNPNNYEREMQLMSARLNYCYGKIEAYEFVIKAFFGIKDEEREENNERDFV